MHKLRKSAIVVAVLAFAWSVAMAASPAVLTAPATSDDARNTCDWGIGASVEQPGSGEQDVLTWVNKAVIPTEGVSRTAGAFDPTGKFHLVCGNCQTHTSHANDQVYDPAANTWTEGLAHPVGGGVGLHNHNACAIGDKIYVGGGSSGAAFYDNLTCLDVTANTWTVEAAMPTASLLYYGMAAQGGKVYVFGGYDQTSVLSTVNEYDPGTTTWTPKAPMPATRRDPVCVAWGDTVYVIGGFAAMAYNGTTTLYKYCPSTDIWTTGAAFAAGTGWGRAVVYDDPALGPVIYLIAGYNSAGAIVNTVSTYSIRTGVWGTETGLIGSRRSHAGDISSDGKIFVAGGYSGAILATSEMATVAPAAGVDVGVQAIRVPGTQVVPGTPLNPKGVVRNYGTSPQSNIPVYCQIDSFGTAIYNQTLNITGPVNAGDTATALFSTAWTPGTSPYYAIKMFTSLTGDTTRGNDTARVTATTWTNIAVPAESVNRIVHATVYDPAGDKIYMIGGNPAGQTATYLAYNHQYDPVANTWTTKAPMSAARGWVTGNCVRGKIYVIGGHNNSSAAVATNECYDPGANSWTTKAPRPVAAMSALCGTWRDSLIYIMGGYDGVSAGLTAVDVYDPFADAWYSGTALPQNADMGGAAIIGDTIYITNAVARATSSCWMYLYKGYIDPTSPATITWIQGPAHASPTSITGATAVNGKVIWLGGFINLTTPTDRVWAYDPATGAITDFPANYVTTIARHHMVAGRTVANELYVMAGDSGCNWAAPNRKYCKIAVPTVITSIEEPRPAMGLPLSLSAVSPNPVKGSAQVSYTLAVPGRVSLALYDAAGRVAARFVESEQAAGEYRLNVSVANLVRGVYLLELRTAGASTTAKLVVN
jgi:N-acetylneuraminic acid mutarotase